MLVLAGGLGTRLRSVVRDVPKPMAPVGERPFLEYLLDFWIARGISKIVISIGYLGEVIERHFGSEYRGASIRYVHEETPLGTGGAIKYALESGSWTSPFVLIVNGDTWCEVDLARILSQAAESAAVVTISAKELDLNDRYGGIRVDDRGRVRAFGVAPPNNNIINTGCYLVDRVRVLRECDALPERFSFEQTVLVSLSESGRCAASIQDGLFLDIGVPEDYAKATDLLCGAD